MTVSGTAGGFTAATLATAKLAVCTVEAAPIRIREDGTAPTATVGTLYNVGDQFQVYGSENLKNFSAIATTGVSATLDCEYSR